MKTVGKLALSSTLNLAVFVVLTFAPAGTPSYWQGWAFLAVFTVSTTVPTIYLMRTNPAALERRMRAGPFAESRMIQKIIICVAIAAFAATIVLSALDHRFGWSSVPTAICLLGDLLVAVGLGVAMAVIIQNGYAAANVTVESGQQVISTGLYGLVRHPMYTGNIALMIGMPLALGSYWGLVFIIPGLVVLVLRIRDEEQLLTQELSGYAQYTRQVHYRLLPYLW